MTVKGTKARGALVSAGMLSQPTKSKRLPLSVTSLLLPIKPPLSCSSVLLSALVTRRWPSSARYMQRTMSTGPGAFQIFCMHVMS